MKLYHYTSVTLGEAILSDSISQGHLTHANGEISHGVAWFTTDPNPAGHGLLRGDEVFTRSQRAHQERVTGRPLRNNVALDKTAIRIAVDVDPATNPRLMSFMDYAKKYESKDWAKVMGLSAIVDLGKLTAKDIKKLIRTASTKETTWWVSFGPVTAEHFVGVDFNTGGGKFVPYEFEAQGRKAMLACGFAAPDQAAQAGIAEIVRPAHALERPKALVFCDDPAKAPKVVVRGGGTTRGFEIEGGRQIVGTECEETAPLQQWIAKHEDQLQANWREAREVFFSYYPEQRPAATAAQA